jgi:hypothetical protein
MEAWIPISWLAAFFLGAAFGAFMEGRKHGLLARGADRR